MQRAWFLIDGLDEVDPDALDVTLAWIAALQEQFPRANFMITSRPQDELIRPFESRQEYEIWRVDDLAESSAVLAATKWFDALEERDSKWASNETRDRLVAQFLTPTDLRELATTPLVVAMLCAFYASGRQSGGLGRTELYKDVCAVLVDLRENETGLVSLDRFHADADAKLRVIGSIAIAALTDGRQSIRLRPTDMKVEETNTLPTPGSDSALLSRDVDLVPARPLLLGTALDIVRQTLARLPRYVGYNESRALDYLLRRSNVFFAASPFEGEFVHRSIMEHLAAREFVTRNGISEMLNLSISRAQFRPVVLVAADLANETQAESILRNSLEGARTTTSFERRRTHIMACIRILAGSRISDPDLVEEVHQVASEFLPPRSIEVAQLLASLGPEILPWLIPQHNDGDLGRFEIGLEGVLSVGGVEALPYLADLARRPEAVYFTSSFLRAWSRFDLIEYAHVVLSNLDFATTAVQIRTEKQLDLIAGFPSVRQVRVLSKVSSGRRHDLTKLRSLRSVDLSSNHLIKDFSGLLLPDGCVAVVAADTSLESLGGADLSAVQTLWVPQNSRLKDFNEIRRMPRLKVLNLASNPGYDKNDVSLLSCLPNLTNLDLSGAGVPGDGEVLGELTQLRRLTLAQSSALSSLTWMQHTPRLRSITTGITASCSNMEQLEAMLELREVRITNRVAAQTVEALLSVPNLTKLVMDASDGFTAVPPGPPVKLIELTLRASNFVAFAGFDRFSTIKALDLSDSTELESLDGLQGCKNLEVLRLNGCRSLRDIDALVAALPRLRVLEMLDGVPFVEPTVTLRARIAAGLEVKHDPYDPFGTVSS